MNLFKNDTSTALEHLASNFGSFCLFVIWSVNDLVVSRSHYITLFEVSLNPSKLKKRSKFLSTEELNIHFNFLKKRLKASDLPLSFQGFSSECSFSSSDSGKKKIYYRPEL